MKVVFTIISIIWILSSTTAINNNTNNSYGWKNNPGHWFGTFLSQACSGTCWWYLISHYIV